MRTKFSLEFSVSTCQGCGSDTYILGVDCFECGRAPRKGELNAAVIRRAQGVRSIRRMLDSAIETDSRPIPYFRVATAWKIELAECLPRVVRALGDFVDRPSNTEVQGLVVAEVGNLRRLSAALEPLPPRRPFVTEINANKAALRHLTSATDHYLEALVALSPIAAQRSADQAQQEIDRATAVLERANSSREFLDALRTQEAPDYLTLSMRALSVVATDRTVTELDEEVRVELLGTIGRSIHPGLGADFAVSRAIAESFLDQERFAKVAADAAHIFGNAGDLAALAAEDGSVKPLARARQAILNAVQTFEASLEVAKSEQARLRVVLNLYREVFEEAVTPLMAWGLRASGPKSKPVLKLIEEGATELLGSVQRSPELMDLFFGADANIRNAASHGQSYELVNDVVAFRLRSYKESMTVEVLVDLMLAMMESCLAVLWALENELRNIGIDGATLPQEMLEDTSIAFVNELLGAFGIHVESSWESETSWRFELADSQQADLFVLAVVIAQLPFGGKRSIEITCAGSVEEVVEISKAHILRYGQAQELEGPALIAAHVDLLVSMHRGGRRLLTDDQLRSASALAAHMLLVDANRDAIALLRRCRYVALDTCPEVAEFCVDTLKEWQLGDPARGHRLESIRAQWSALPQIGPPSLLAIRVT